MAAHCPSVVLWHAASHVPRSWPLDAAPVVVPFALATPGKHGFPLAYRLLVYKKVFTNHRRSDMTQSGFKRRDVIKGLRGNDRICGGAGRDKLIGGPGHDKLVGGPGKDITHQ